MAASSPPASSPLPGGRPLRRQAVRQLVEVAAIVLAAAIVHRAWAAGAIGPTGVCLLVTALAVAKTAYFLCENLQHILLATSHEIPYHRFLALMGVNMAQITASFALDFWLLELAENAFKKDPKLEGLKAYVNDSGEGRWTVNEAIALAVPVPTIAASLFARFTSRQESSFAMRVLAALRNEFGGHAVKKA